MDLQSGSRPSAPRTSGNILSRSLSRVLFLTSYRKSSRRGPSAMAGWRERRRDLFSASAPPPRLGKPSQRTLPNYRSIRSTNVWTFSISARPRSAYIGARPGSCGEPFLQAMGEVMERQAKLTTLDGSPARQLHIVYPVRVQDAVHSLEETELPEALGHMDLNPGNIVCAPFGSVFLDWAEAFVGHPFLTFGYLREHCRRTFGQEQPQEMQLLENYAFSWRAFVSGDQIRRALNLTPLSSPYSRVR